MMLSNLSISLKPTFYFRFKQSDSLSQSAGCASLDAVGTDVEDKAEEANARHRYIGVGVEEWTKS